MARKKGPGTGARGAAARRYGGRRAARALALAAVMLAGAAACGPSGEEIAYSALKQRIAAGQVAEVRVSMFAVEAVPTDAARAAGAPELWTAVPVPGDETLVALLDRHRVTYGGMAAGGGASPWVAVPVLVGIVLVVVGIVYVQKRVARKASGVDDMRVRDAAKARLGVDFADVAGVDEAKEELVEIVEFLKHPDRFARLGAKIPRGVLLVGPPGTGKTLLAKAVAGEAGVPFFSISGSEFVEVYVGVGASRVRKLFERAKSRAPCIVFIDELDAAGKRRGHGGVAGNDEREQTLNQLLVEMDGFDPNAGVVVMAATNRPEILDPALLRPGRFDRQVVVDRPDVKGREAILRVHARRVRLDPGVDLGEVARRTPGFVGADLANLLNEAALLAARRNRSAVTMQDIDAAADRVVAGLEKKGRLLHERERRIVAYHEAGHAVVAESVPTAEPVKKVSIIPRGAGALGYMQQLPEERLLLQQDELLDRLAVLLGGRAAERVVFDKVSTGASNDLERATELARRMVTEFGMSETLGPVAYARRESRFLHAGPGDGARATSEATAREIEMEVQAIVSAAFERARAILERRRAAFEAVAAHLLAHEVLERDELLRILEAERAA
ncbi:MAG TPA: ATP-dependent zinc metalloprotease FtsH [Longimicrobiales bacterium]